MSDYTEDKHKFVSAGVGIDDITKVAGIEARGFTLATPVAVVLGAGFIPLRKPGKLPYETVKEEYELEYGIDALEVHIDAVHDGEKVLLVDDVIATGGTAKAAIQLLRSVGAEVVGFSADGGRGVSGGADGTVRLWGLPAR